jgi:hypothetical protein
MTEIQQQRKVIEYRLSSKEAPMPEFARMRPTKSEAFRAALKAQAVYFEHRFLNRVSELANKKELLPIEENALVAFRRMRSIIGHKNNGGLSDIFEYCALHAEKIAESAQKVRNLEGTLGESASSSPAFREAKKVLGGYLYPIRGNLGEIYLHHWPEWQIQLSGLLEIASDSARKLGKDWSPKVFSGGLFLDGKKVWDEGILLLKAPTSTDKIPRAALHTAAQIKVAEIVLALEQTIKDRFVREIGRTKLPRLSIIEEGLRRDFVLEVLPPDIGVVRYVFNAYGGDLRGIKSLKSSGLKVYQMELDASVSEFEAMAAQIIDVVRELVLASK